MGQFPVGSGQSRPPDAIVAGWGCAARGSRLGTRGSRIATRYTRTLMNHRALRRFLIPALLAAVTIAIYVPTLGFGFVLDDSWQIQMNRSRFGWHDIPGYFTNDLW